MIADEAAGNRHSPCTTPYTSAYYDREEADVLASARIIAPLVMRLCSPQSVVDFGCGRGAWLRVFQECEVETVLGLDGPHVDPGHLLIAPEVFRAVDLSRPITTPDRYDLALCLEVGEHLPKRACRSLVSSITSAAPVVLFSAAIPGQGGTHHVNEQWSAFWDALFADHDFQKMDPIRREIWFDKRVKWYYRQNIVMYAATRVVEQSQTLLAETAAARDSSTEWVHVRVLNRQIRELTSPRGILRSSVSLIPRAARRARALVMRNDR